MEAFNLERVPEPHKEFFEVNGKSFLGNRQTSKALILDRMKNFSRTLGPPVDTHRCEMLC